MQGQTGEGTVSSLGQSIDRGDHSWRTGNLYISQHGFPEINGRIGCVRGIRDFAEFLFDQNMFHFVRMEKNLECFKEKRHEACLRTSLDFQTEANSYNSKFREVTTEINMEI